MTAAGAGAAGDVVELRGLRVVGTSRKSFLGRITGNAPVEDRLEASVATATWAMAEGAAMVRVHDVRETVHAARLLGDVVGAPA